MASKQINKKFVLSDSTVNEYGFRLLSSGYQLGEFQKNPIGYYMHQRDGGVVVKWCDLCMDDDQVTAYPEINLSNTRGQQTADEVENGFLNAASVGHIVVLEYSNDPELMLPGQTGPTITKWYNKECSLVDIPGNYNALTQLYDEDDNALNLADFTNKSIVNMKSITLTPELLKSLSLADSSDGTDVIAAINSLTDRAAIVTTLQAENTDLQTEVANLRAAFGKKQVADMLDKAMEEKRITVALKNKLAAQYANNPTDLKDLLASMPKYQAITDTIQVAENLRSEKASSLLKLNWDELDRSDKLKELKEQFPELYAQKFEEHFNHKPGEKAKA
ncbi:MAG TPA: phage protease [Flavipsychrobacter sp.]|nr:phage protease [Flavipsychrobacter sp.]